MKDESKMFSKLRNFLTNQDDDLETEEEYERPGGFDKTNFNSDSDVFENFSSSANNSSYSESNNSPYSSPFNDSEIENKYNPSQFDSYNYSSNINTKSSSDNAYYSPKQNSNVYQMKTKPKFTLSILRLERLEDAVKVADEIMSGNTISLIDLRNVNKEIQRRIIDFLDGVRYTCDAKMEIVADFTFVVVPKDVELTGDLFSQIDTSSYT